MQDTVFTEFQPGNIIDNPSEDRLREWALKQGGVLTEFGNLSVKTRVRNRIARFTEVVLGEPDQEYIKLIGDVMAYLRDREMIMLDRVMCQKEGYKRKCRIYVTADYPRIPLMWGSTLFPGEPGEPDFITITVSEWPEKKVLVFPEEGFTLILGSDYKGENKKAMLRQVMYWSKKEGNLGLHAASKILRIQQNGKLVDMLNPKEKPGSDKTLAWLSAK